MTQYPAPTNTTNIVNLLTYYSTETSGWLGNLFLIMLFISLFIILMRRSAPEAAVGAGFITSVIGFLMSMLGLCGSLGWVIPLVITCIAGGAMYYSDSL